MSLLRAEKLNRKGADDTEARVSRQPLAGAMFLSCRCQVPRRLPGAGIVAGSYPARRRQEFRADNVAGKQGHELAHVADQRWDIEDHVGRSSLLAEFSIHF
jgi:hypothetical protein